MNKYICIVQKYENDLHISDKLLTIDDLPYNESTQCQLIIVKCTLSLIYI